MKQLKVFLLILLSCLLTLSVASAQTLAVRGIVSDIYGEPIPGVNVLAKGTAAGTFTDVDGNYTLETDASAVLEFSSIGFRTVQVKVEGRAVINVSMETDRSSCIRNSQQGLYHRSSVKGLDGRPA